MKVRDRVKEFKRVKASELRQNPKNWREHPEGQRRALQGVLDEVGIAGALIARETPDGLELIDGHLRSDVDSETEWPVLVLDVDENEADILLASIDPIGSMAEENEIALSDLLSGLVIENEYLSEILSAIDEPDYSILDSEDVESQLDSMEGEAKRGLLIEFNPDDYNDAAELSRAHRKAGKYVGGIFLRALREAGD